VARGIEGETDPNLHVSAVASVSRLHVERHRMSGHPRTNEWNLLKDQFDALAHDESVGADAIENIFDAQFRRRFSELINRIAESKSRTHNESGHRAFRRFR
jgi:hypothetical protein